MPKVKTVAPLVFVTIQLINVHEWAVSNWATHFAARSLSHACLVWRTFLSSCPNPPKINVWANICSKVFAYTLALLDATSNKSIMHIHLVAAEYVQLLRRRACLASQGSTPQWSWPLELHLLTSHMEHPGWVCVMHIWVCKLITLGSAFAILPSIPLQLFPGHWRYSRL